MFRDKSGGFTLIELLIVLVIVSILASITISQYIKYQYKAKLSSHAEPIARFCLMDIISYCNENPNKSINTNELKSCSNTTVINYDVSIYLKLGVCNSAGFPQQVSVRAYLSNVPGYAECEFTGSKGGIKCIVR